MFGSTTSSRLASRNYELAARMQMEAMKVADISKETEATKKLYGMDQTGTEEFGNRCLLARRLIESGVRFVQLISASGGGNGWDTHRDIQGALPGLCNSIDKPMTGLLTDLKQRGMLEDTLVVWSSEFGRLPTIEARSGNPDATTIRTVSICGWPAQECSRESTTG